MYRHVKHINPAKSAKPSLQLTRQHGDPDAYADQGISIITERYIQP